MTSPNLSTRMVESGASWCYNKWKMKKEIAINEIKSSFKKKLTNFLYIGLPNW